jgi:hypothetical protein
VERSRTLACCHCEEPAHDQDQAEPTGKKTKEQQRRTLEGKPNLPCKDNDGKIATDVDDDERAAPILDRSKRQSEFPVSRGGMNQESHIRLRTQPLPSM